jgi:hypothetical protein
MSTMTHFSVSWANILISFDELTAKTITYASSCSTNIHSINRGKNVFPHSKNLFSGAVDTNLAKHHKNSGAELLHPGVLEQSSSRTEQSPAKHALRLIYALVIIRSKSSLVIFQKWLSRPDMDFMNIWLCLLDSPMHRHTSCML